MFIIIHDTEFGREICLTIGHYRAKIMKSFLSARRMILHIASLARCFADLLAEIPLDGTIFYVRKSLRFAGRARDYKMNRK